jgi:hypothetical protein
MGRHIDADIGTLENDAVEIFLFHACSARKRSFPKVIVPPGLKVGQAAWAAQGSGARSKAGMPFADISPRKSLSAEKAVKKWVKRSISEA